jgi:demethylmenaquinone methyltransferase/2-methoxy-6-polyprenyl-1,4-benzoquinol methylase
MTTTRNEQEGYEAIFSSIAHRYDLMKTLLSGGQEPRWKAAMFKRCVPDPPERWLDIATGTGEFFRFASDCPDGMMIGFDRNREMLQVARSKNYRGRVFWVLGDLDDLPFRKESVDLITVGYGLRYCSDIQRFAHDCFALVRPGGRIFSFDVGHPSAALKPIWYAYLFCTGTILGTLLHGKPTTYWHLWQTLRAFPGQKQVCRLFKLAGFQEVFFHNLLNGMMYGHCAEKDT